jgi:CBS domain-containing protein
MSKHNKKNRSSQKSSTASGAAATGSNWTEKAADLADNVTQRLPSNFFQAASYFVGGVALGLGASYLLRRGRGDEDVFDAFFDDDRPVLDVMTDSPVMCTPDTPLTEIARRMVEADCGAIPVVEDEGSRKPIGMITDRDIVVRSLAEGKNPSELVARDCMTPATVTVPYTASIHECLLVVDEEGRCVGIVAQADIALELSPGQTQELVGEVSAATGTTQGPAAA